MMYSEHLKESIERCNKDIEWAVKFMAYARKDINREKESIKRMNEYGYRNYQYNKLEKSQ